MHELLIAATAVALVALAYWYSNRTPAAPQNTSNYTATANALQWASDAQGAYTCPNSLSADWCILPTAAAGAAACDADSSCAGYLVPGDSLTSSGTFKVLAQSYPGVVQLYSAPLVDCASCTDTTVMAKNSA
jgi:hypothetical protein